MGGRTDIFSATYFTFPFVSLVGVTDIPMFIVPVDFRYAHGRHEAPVGYTHSQYEAPVGYTHSQYEAPVRYTHSQYEAPGGTAVVEPFLHLGAQSGR